MDKTSTNKDNFTTILVIAGVSLAIFFLLKPCKSQSNFTNNAKKPVENKK